MPYGTGPRETSGDRAKGKGMLIGAGVTVLVLLLAAVAIAVVKPRCRQQCAIRYPRTGFATAGDGITNLSQSSGMLNPDGVAVITATAAPGAKGPSHINLYLAGQPESQLIVLIRSG